MKTEITVKIVLGVSENVSEEEVRKAAFDAIVDMAKRNTLLAFHSESGAEIWFDSASLAE